MAVCEHCGNEYDKSFQVIRGGKTHNFDSFECAIHALAPPLIAASRSWATAWRKTARFTAATTAPKPKGCRVCAIGSSRPIVRYTRLGPGTTIRITKLSCEDADQITTVAQRTISNEPCWPTQARSSIVRTELSQRIRCALLWNFRSSLSREKN
jgi:hypothetical protein